jgi:uncharacterized protein
MNSEPTQQNGSKPDLSPREQHERIETLDILRGFAIFGILVVNMGIFAYPFLGYQIMGGSPWDDTVNSIAENLIRFFAEGKFYSIFSMLFGAGIVLQFTRAESRGVKFKPYYLRRMSVLLIIGLFHALLFWMGDILALYAFCGFALLLFLKRKPRTLIIWIVIFLLIPILLVAGLFGLMSLAETATDAAEDIEQQLEGQKAFATWLIDGAYAAYRDGTIGQIFIFRAIEYAIVLLSGIFWFPNVFAMMLIGVYAMKTGMLTRMLDDRMLTVRLFFICFVTGIVFNVLYAYSYAVMDPIRTNVWYVLMYVGIAIGAPSLAISYISGIVLLSHKAAWHKRLQSLAPVGKMALSNYLLHTIICTTLFYNYGFGLYGSVGPAAGFGIAILIFSMQIYLSPVWLRYFHYGPVEWLWRTLTYKKRQPFKRKAKDLSQTIA